jgi:NTP pyrophosphatase (non-canonical NTP hydrolase)
MHFSDYQYEACTFIAFPEDAAVTYPLLALQEEVGEVSGKVAKALRKGWLTGNALQVGRFPPGLLREVESELGDVLWNVAVLAKGLGLSLEDIAIGNLDKLEARRYRGTIIGEGDNR